MLQVFIIFWHIQANAPPQFYALVRMECIVFIAPITDGWWTKMLSKSLRLFNSLQKREYQISFESHLVVSEQHFTFTLHQGCQHNGMYDIYLQIDDP